MTVGLIGRKVGMMRLYDGSGRSRGVSVIEFAPNYVTQLRTEDRDGYTAVQIGARGRRKRVNRPMRGHLRTAGLENEVITAIEEFRVDDTEAYSTGQALTVEQFEPGAFVNVTGVTKGRGFAGVVRRWNFAGGPKTHGQSDRHRAPGSIGAGTSPGKVWKGQKMGGHMGMRRKTSMNLLVVQSDPIRNLLFVEGSVPGPNGATVTVVAGRRTALVDYDPPVLPAVEDEIEPPTVEDAAALEAVEQAEEPEETDEPDAADEPEAAADTTEEPAAEEGDESAAGGDDGDAGEEEQS